MVSDVMAAANEEFSRRRPVAGRVNAPARAIRAI